jgi:hypothetical protein
MIIGAIPRGRLKPIMDRNIAGLLIRHKAIAARAIRNRMAARAINNKRIAGRRIRPLMLRGQLNIGAIAAKRGSPPMIYNSMIEGAIGRIIRMFAGSRKDTIRRIAE